MNPKGLIARAGDDAAFAGKQDLRSHSYDARGNNRQSWHQDIDLVPPVQEPLELESPGAVRSSLLKGGYSWRVSVDAAGGVWSGDAACYDAYSRGGRFVVQEEYPSGEYAAVLKHNPEFAARDLRQPTMVFRVSTVAYRQYEAWYLSIVWPRE